MAWAANIETPIDKISEEYASCPEVETDYVDPAIGRSLAEHLKTYWLVRRLYGYAPGYEANKIKETLETQKFTDRDWAAVARVCGFSKSWAGRQKQEATANKTKEDAA